MRMHTLMHAASHRISISGPHMRPHFKTMILLLYVYVPFFVYVSRKSKFLFQNFTHEDNYQPYMICSYKLIHRTIL
jgi:hypothetical protein